MLKHTKLDRRFFRIRNLSAATKEAMHDVNAKLRLIRVKNPDKMFKQLES